MNFSKKRLKCYQFFFISTFTFNKNNLSLQKTQPKMANNCHMVLVDITEANMKCGRSKQPTVIMTLIKFMKSFGSYEIFLWQTLQISRLHAEKKWLKWPLALTCPCLRITENQFIVTEGCNFVNLSDIWFIHICLKPSRRS